jgi:hypothetical protein
MVFLGGLALLRARFARTYLSTLALSSAPIDGVAPGVFLAGVTRTSSGSAPLRTCSVTACPSGVDRIFEMTAWGSEG